MESTVNYLRFDCLMLGKIMKNLLPNGGLIHGDLRTNVTNHL